MSRIVVLGACLLMMVGFHLVAQESPASDDARATADDNAPGEAPGAPPHVIAVVDDVPITLPMYERFLLEEEGLSRLEELIDRVLLQQEARRLKVSFPYEQVERRIDARIERLTRMFGDEALFADSLHRHQKSIAVYRRWLEQDYLWEAVADQIVLARRSPQEVPQGEADDVAPTSPEGASTPTADRRDLLEDLRKKAAIRKNDPEKALRSYLRAG